MKRGLIGVYKITNIINGKFYIGSSVDVSNRYSTHLGRDARDYQNKHPFYSEIIKYGKENFVLELLEECDRELLIEREQYYYDKLKPVYNKVRPAENNFVHKEVQEKANRNSNTPELVKRRKELYNSPEYLDLFRHMHVNKMKSVDMIENDLLIRRFISLRDAARYISENFDYKGKNKTSKIKAVCDGERKTAYGYEWRYSKV